MILPRKDQDRALTAERFPACIVQGHRRGDEFQASAPFRLAQVCCSSDFLAKGNRPDSSYFLKAVYGAGRQA